MVTPSFRFEFQGRKTTSILEGTKNFHIETQN